MDGLHMDSKNEHLLPSSHTPSEQHEIKARVDAVWEQMNKGVSTKTLNSIINSSSSSGKGKPLKSKASDNWMTFLGLGSKRKEPDRASVSSTSTTTATTQNGTSDEAKKLAAAALAAARDITSASSALARGKVEVTEIRDFAGQDIEVKKLVDPNELDKVSTAGPTSAVDAILDQIKKKQKLNVLDKTKKDWGEFKDENKGLEDELEAYKKSSGQYTERVSFLQRTDYREFERERDARLALNAKKKTDMCEDLD